MTFIDWYHSALLRTLQNTKCQIVGGNWATCQENTSGQVAHLEHHKHMKKYHFFCAKNSIQKRALHPRTANCELMPQMTMPHCGTPAAEFLLC